MKSTITKKSIKSEILRSKSPTRSPIAVLQDWIKSGHKVTISELRFISLQLQKSKRYHHALEIMKWMEAQKGFQISSSDHATRIELILKVQGLTEAEEYFSQIRGTANQKAASLPLLHGYVKERAVEKAESLMMKLNELGLLVSPHPFNEMMKLYMATSQYDKVPAVIMQMKQNRIPTNILSFNLWMNACGEVSGVAAVEAIYREIMNNGNVEVGWSTLCTLANVYVKAGLVEKAVLVLKNAEKKLNTSKHLGYFFLITMYVSINNKEGVIRVWEACKSVSGRMTCGNYMCMLSCLVKLGDLVEAEKVFVEWESNCKNYDVRVSNVLLAAYVRNGLMEKAEAFHVYVLEKGGCPNYKTWEILMEGWVRSQDMEKAIDAMKKSFAMMKGCQWRPSEAILMSIVEYYEKHGNFQHANHLIRMIHHFGLASLPLYKVLLRMHINAQRPAFNILKMMVKDKIEMNGETSACFSSLCKRESARE